MVAAARRAAPTVSFASDRPMVMGVLNVTPDSFSDGGRYSQVDLAEAHARRLAAEGADIVDIGGESTRPGFTPIDAAEELRRVVPVLDALAGQLRIPISIDTTKSVVAREALARGATMVNDIWGLQGDPAMAGVVAEAGAAVVLMHNRATKDDAVDIVDDMIRFFDTSLAIAAWAGIARSRLVLDPGVGFGKTPRQQIEAILGIPRLLSFGLPVLVGLSRKSFIGALSGAPVERRLIDTVAANLAALAGGATIFRVHDVAEHVAALKVYATLRPGAGHP